MNPSDLPDRTSTTTLDRSSRASLRVYFTPRRSWQTMRRYSLRRPI